MEYYSRIQIIRKFLLISYLKLLTANLCLFLLIPTLLFNFETLCHVMSLEMAVISFFRMPVCLSTEDEFWYSPFMPYAFCSPCHCCHPTFIQEPLSFCSTTIGIQPSRGGLLRYCTAEKVQIILFCLYKKYLSWYVGDLTNKGDYGVAPLNIINRGATILWQKISIFRSTWEQLLTSLYVYSNITLENQHF